MGSQAPHDLDVEVKCSTFAHFPNPDVPGLWGELRRQEFKEACPVVLNRRNILVYNVIVFCVTVGPPKERVKRSHLDLPSLRALSRAAPEEYPMPKELPDSHVSLDSDKGRKAPAKRKPAGAANATAGRKNTAGGAARAEVSSAQRKRKAPAVVETVSEDESSAAEDSDVAHSGSDSEEPSYSSSERSDSSEESDCDVGSDRGDGFPPAAHLRSGALLELPQPTPSLRKGMYGFANNSSDSAMGESDFPISPFYCEGSTDAPADHVHVRYFHRKGGEVPQGKLRGTRYTPATWVYQKYWQDASFGQYSKFMRGEKRKKIPETYLETNWKKELLHKKYVLPLEVPEESVPKDHLRTDKLVLPMSFVMEQLLPLAVSYHAV